MRQAHSEKTLETLRLLDCPLTGWGHPEIEWVKMKMLVPTQTTCKTCHGGGRIYPNGRDGERCPKCPPKRGWSNHGTGIIMKEVEREVEVGFYKWKSNTIFGSRFDNHGDQCQLCGKAPIKHWTAVEGTDKQGRTHVLFVGEDCGRTILGVSSVGMALDVAQAKAANAKEQRALWREIPKPPKPVKPAKPTLVNPPSRADFDAIVASQVPTAHLDYPRLDVTKAELVYWFIIDTGKARTAYRVKLSARHGVTIKRDSHPEKVLLKEKTQDVLDAFRRTIKAIAADSVLPGNS